MDPLSVTIKIRLTTREKESFERCSGIAGIGLSAWIRERLRTVATRELEQVGEVAPFIAASRGMQR